MSSEQKIEGLPDGYQVARLEHWTTANGNSYWKAILEPIPKPKQTVIIAEFIVPDPPVAVANTQCILETQGKTEYGCPTTKRTMASIVRVEEREL